MPCLLSTKPASLAEALQLMFAMRTPAPLAAVMAGGSAAASSPAVDSLRAEGSTDTRMLRDGDCNAGSGAASKEAVAAAGTFNREGLRDCSEAADKLLEEEVDLMVVIGVEDQADSSSDTTNCGAAR